ncbi:MAG: hypothetical protein PVS2B1_04860 [Candidatus Dormibacteraceae bacterium]
MIVAVVVIVAALFLGGVGWAIWWLNDNIGAPGPGATGSGQCTSADSVNIQMVFADGHSVQACTHDRPLCPNHTISGSINGVNSSVSEFGFGNQLRSSSRRYIFGVRFNSTLPAEASEQTVSLTPGKWLMPGAPTSSTLTNAYVSITPRDPQAESYLVESGSITISATHGAAKGRIEGKFSGHGPTRPDRPAYSPAAESPVSISGTFACNH